MLSSSFSLTVVVSFLSLTSIFRLYSPSILTFSLLNLLPSTPPHRDPQNVTSQWRRRQNKVDIFVPSQCVCCVSARLPACDSLCVCVLLCAFVYGLVCHFLCVSVHGWVKCACIHHGVCMYCMCNDACMRAWPLSFPAKLPVFYCLLLQMSGQLIIKTLVFLIVVIQASSSTLCFMCVCVCMYTDECVYVCGDACVSITSTWFHTVF